MCVSSRAVGLLKSLLSSGSAASPEENRPEPLPSSPLPPHPSRLVSLGRVREGLKCHWFLHRARSGTGVVGLMFEVSTGASSASRCKELFLVVNPWCGSRCGDRCRGEAVKLLAFGLTDRESEEQQGIRGEGSYRKGIGNRSRKHIWTNSWRLEQHLMFAHYPQSHSNSHRGTGGSRGADVTDVVRALI